jgi:hypothetical protein
MLFIFSTPELIKNLWQLKKAVFLHWCQIRAGLSLSLPIAHYVPNNRRCQRLFTYRITMLQKAFLMLAFSDLAFTQLAPML